MIKKMLFHIDVVDACNLQCPSCPRGNMSDIPRNSGVMSPELLDRILKKAATECKQVGVGLFNWTEPFLHPRLDEMVRVVRENNAWCHVSSNLNLGKMDRYRKVLEQKPHRFRISLSGFDQKEYEVSHKGGSAKNVIENLNALMQLRKELNSTTVFDVMFIRHLSNFDQAEAIKAYCEKHNILFTLIDQLWLPLEKVFSYCGEPSFPEITPQDANTIANLSLPLKQTLDAVAQIETKACPRLEEQISLNWKGDVMVCCGTYDNIKYFVGNYIDDSLETIQSARRNHMICSLCVKYGLLHYYSYNIPGKDQLVAENIRNHHKNNNKLKEFFQCIRARWRK